MTNEQRKAYLEEQLIMLKNQIEFVSKELDKVNANIKTEKLWQDHPGATQVYEDGSYDVGNVNYGANGQWQQTNVDGMTLEK